MRRLIIKILLSAILLSLVILNIESRELIARLSRISFWSVMGAFLCLVIQSMLVSGRWRIILKTCSKEIPYLEVIKMHYISLGASLFLPNIVAEPALKSLLTKKFNISISASILSVILDKLFVVAGLFVMTIFVLPIILIMYKTTDELDAGYMFMLACIFVLYMLALLSRKTSIKEVLINRISNIEMLMNIHKYLITDRKLIIRCLIITMISQIVSTTAFYILSISMKTPLSYYDCLLLITPAQLITTIPIAFNGWGIREISIIYMLNMVDISPSTSLVLSIQYGLIGILLWSMGLLTWLFYNPKLTLKADA